MNQQSLFSQAPLPVAVKNDNILIKNQQKPKKIVGSPVTNKFFKSSISSSLPLKPITNKSNNKPLQLMDSEVNHSEIIYSEDVSRKKIKLGEKYRKKKCYSTLNNNEDFLENLKKKFDKKSMSQLPLEKDIQVEQNSKLRRKPLFTDESLDLMNNFKKYFKDNVLQDSLSRETSGISKLNKSSIIASQENIENQIDTPENHNDFDVNYHTPTNFREQERSSFERSVTSSCSTKLVRNADLSSESSFRHNEIEIQNMFSPLQTPDLFESRSKMLENMNDDTDDIDQFSSPELPQIDLLNFQYSHHSNQQNVQNSNFLSYF